MTSATDAPDQIVYMNPAASIGADYKRQAIDALGLTAGHAVADLGCGPGTDLGMLADAVGPTGTVHGVDRDERMLTAARERSAELSTVELRAGDLHALPLADASLDAARTDRVLQHVDDPAAALAEIRRVLRVGGRFVATEPDWDTLAVADSDVDTSRRFARFTAGRVRNATIGRELARLGTVAGLSVRDVRPVPMLFSDFGTADAILGLCRNSARAVETGAMEPAATEAWLDRLAAGPLVAGFTLYLVVLAR